MIEYLRFLAIFQENFEYFQRFFEQILQGFRQLLRILDNIRKISENFGYFWETFWKTLTNFEKILVSFGQILTIFGRVIRWILKKVNKLLENLIISGQFLKTFDNLFTIFEKIFEILAILQKNIENFHLTLRKYWQSVSRILKFDIYL